MSKMMMSNNKRKADGAVPLPEEKLRLQEEGECRALRRKFALFKELKAKMEDQEARLALREKQQETPV